MSTPSINNINNSGVRINYLAVIVPTLLLIFFGIAFAGSGIVKTGESVSAWNPITDIKNFFSDNNDDEETSTQIIKVVDEQSQVISVVEKTSPAVVSIIATAEVSRMSNCYGPMDYYNNIPEEFKKYFKIPDDSQCEESTETVKVGAGTGFIVSSDGYIVTNKHVVTSKTKDTSYTVILNDKENKDKKIIAKVMAIDPSNDIAVLKIDMNNLPYIEFGDSNTIKVGQTAIAIGFALGEFDNTVSKGVVSGLSRSISARDQSNATVHKLQGLIQTDAAINPGNSGGPLLNLSGKAIGINVATANAQNIGFAIPIKFVKKAFEETKKNGTISKTSYPFLGIRYLYIDAIIKEKNKLPYDYGIIVLRGENRDDLAVIPGSAADIAGIVENDIILEIDGKKIDKDSSLSNIIREYHIGDKITLKVYSKGKIKDVKTKLQASP